MPDFSDKWTEQKIRILERRIERLYGVAIRDVREMIDDFWNGKKYTTSDGKIARGKSLADKDAAFRKMVERGERTEEEYRKWLRGVWTRGEELEKLWNQLAERITHSAEIANEYINDVVPGVYIFGRNSQTYFVERDAGIFEDAFYNEELVSKLLKEYPNLMPNFPKEKAFKYGYNLKWGQEQITKRTISTLARNGGANDIAEDLVRFANFSYTSAIRAARTAITAAINSGRQDTAEKAVDMGINLMKEWHATLDNRTRHSHAMLDGETVDVDSKFPNGCAYPGDPSGPPSEVYNCRCGYTTVLKDHQYNGKRSARDPETGKTVEIDRMTYQEWAEWKKSQNPESWDIYMKMGRNASADKKEYKSVRDLLGDRAPYTLYEFQNIKYKDPEKWETLKSLIKGAK